MFRLKLTEVPDLLANKKLGGATDRFRPAEAPAGAISVALQSSRPLATPPELSTHISSVAEVVVSEIA